MKSRSVHRIYSRQGLKKINLIKLLYISCARPNGSTVRHIRPMCQIWYANVKDNGSKRSDMKTFKKAYRFDLEVKGQHRIRIMNVRNTSSYCDTPMCKTMSIKKSYGPDTKTCQKPYKFDLKVKVQRRIWIMNVRDTSSHSDTPMCQIWLVNVKPKMIMGLTRKHVKNSINLTLRSKFKVVSGS